MHITTNIELTDRNYNFQTSMKINITTKQIEKFNKENGVLHKEGRLEYKEEMAVSQVVAVDLNEVSDIIKPNQVKLCCFSLLYSSFVYFY